MKKAGLFLLILVLSCNFAWSQDTLYIYKAGIVVIRKFNGLAKVSIHELCSYVLWNYQ